MKIYGRFTKVIIIIIITVMIIKWVNDQSNRRIRYRRRYIYTKEELQSTRYEPRIDAKSCPIHNSVAIFVHSAAQSSGKYFDKRQAVRKTWAKVAKDRYNVSTYFVTALSANEDINNEIQSEARKHFDVIQLDFIDAYYNLTLKNVALLRWVSR